MRYVALFGLLYLACLLISGSAHPAAYTAACLGPVAGFLALASLAHRLARPEVLP